jgi:hypothetical protein
MKKDVFFSHIPKTAGRTISDVIEKESAKKNKKIYVGEKYFYEVIYKKQKLYYDYYLQDKYLKKLIKFDNNTYKFEKSKNHWNTVFWHIPLSFWKDELLLDLKKKNIIFLFVRNPYERVISDFKFWIKFYKMHINGPKKKHYLILLNQIKQIYDNNFDLTEKNMNKFIENVFTTKKYKYDLDGHLIPQHKYIYTVINQKLIKIPNEILRFENLENDFINFKKKYLQFIPNKSIKETHLNPTQNRNLNINKLTKKSKDIIYNYYKLDFKILNYPK